MKSPTPGSRSRQSASAGVGEDGKQAKGPRPQPRAVFTALALPLVSLAALAGYQATTTPLASVPFATLEEFSLALSGEGKTVLTEFCTPSDCSCCDKMRCRIEQLAINRKDNLAVYRVDLSNHPQLAWEFSLTACPSYIAFRDGEELFRAEPPTSADRIANQLDEFQRDSASESLAIAIPQASQ